MKGRPWVPPKRKGEYVDTARAQRQKVRPEDMKVKAVAARPFEIKSAEDTDERT